MNLSEAAGIVGGWLLAPITGAIAWVRHARMFHPEGTVWRATLLVRAEHAPWGALASRLAGPALVRLSSAWWRGGREWPDVLGLALRLRASDEVSPAAAPGDQDLLFATIQRPWTTPLAPVSTRVHDFLANDYFAVSPFVADGIAEPIYLRLARPSEGAPAGASRAERLAHAVDARTAVFTLEAARRPRGPWTPLATLHLGARVEIDQAALRFDPFRDGRGVRPRGFVHALRVGAYAASRRARPEREG